MLFVYLDESKHENKFFVYTAVILDGDRWPVAFEKVKAMRRKLRKDHGIYIAKELHAWKFASGKGEISDRVLLKPKRAEIFREVLSFIATAEEFTVISSVNTVEQYAFERLMNRINRTAEANSNHNILLICDEGEEQEITRRIRRMRIHNPIPSNQGTWANGPLGMPETFKNIPLKQFVEDPVFKDSRTSYFIQLADFCAYALLRMERPIESRTILGYDTAYELLRPVCFPKTNPRDPRGMGIIR